MIKQIPKLFRLKKAKFHCLSACFKIYQNPNSHKALSIQPLLLGGNPITTTSIYNLIHFLERKWGVHYATGGTGAIVKALNKLMIEEDIEINLNSEVSEIIFDNKKAIGIKLQNNKEFFSDIIVFNGDSTHAYLNMIPKAKRWTPKKIDKLELSMGLVCYFFWDKKKYPKVEHHTIWMGKRFKGL